MKEYVACIDIGSRRDFYTELVLRDFPRVVDGSEDLRQQNRIVHEYDIVHLARFGGLKYDEMVASTAKLMRNINLINNSDLLVDGTGVGAAVVERMREIRLNPIPIVFTSGTGSREVYDSVRRVFADSEALQPIHVLRELHVAKQDLVAAGQMMMQQQRVHMAQGLDADESKVFLQQLADFRGRVNEKTGYTSFNAETEGAHDDYVVVFLMAAWWMTRRRDEIKERTIPKPGQNQETWDPMEIINNAVRSRADG